MTTGVAHVGPRGPTAGLSERARAAITAALGPSETAYAAWCSIRDAIPLDDITDPDVLVLVSLIWSNTVAAHPEDPDAGRLRGVHHHRWTVASLVARDLLDGVERLDRAGIDVRLAGGLALAARVYPDLGTRPLGDSMMLVPSDQLPAAVAVLRAADGRVDPPGAIGASPSRRPVRWWTPGGTAITLTSRPSPWFADWPQRSTALEITGRTVRTLSAEDELLALLTGSATAIAPASSLWVVDAGRLAAADLIDTEVLLDTIRREDLAAVVGPRLADLAETFGIGFGDGLADAVAALPSTRRDRWLARRAPATLRSDGVVRHARRAILRWLVTSRHLPAWRIVTEAPRYFR